MCGVIGVEVSPGCLVQEMVRDCSAPQVSNAGITRVGRVNISTRRRGKDGHGCLGLGLDACKDASPILLVICVVYIATGWRHEIQVQHPS